MHIYAFGSICRGEIDRGSDVDMLIVSNGKQHNINPSDYSIYSYERIDELWAQGNPFAWHLFLESKLVFSHDNSDYLLGLGKPNPYFSGRADCIKFYEIFKSAELSLKQSTLSQVFDLSSVFLAMRNFASCFSLAFLDCPNFSRRSSLKLGELSVPIDSEVFEILENARILCTRGIGLPPDESQILMVIESLSEIENWMLLLMRRDHL
ncbi:nucleotidyltransferase domain-containing protein [Oceanospirillum sp.]|uniref:nucleotidyltransferase domain-containing protein n=1 Tax=Oceanospirillum sp. TaxID=2021254 RepID=UPI003A905C0B